MSDESSSVVGFDRRVVEPWLASVTPASAPFEWQRLTGGHSNLTYLVRDAVGGEFVFRRPPLGELLPKAHDMWREYRIIRALSATAVPVPAPIAYVDRRDLCDAHFYVMSKVDGAALYTGAEAADYLDRDSRVTAGESFIDTLAALHSLDPSAIGLGDLGRPDGYVDRQLRTWYGSWIASRPAADLDDPRVHELHEWLRSRIPPQSSGRIVHGDFGPHNCLFSSNGTVSAVLDWEIATLGDPLADMAYSINAWSQPGDLNVHGADPATAVDGFPDRAWLIDRYAQRTGADLSELAYFRTFNYFKTACILHGVYARYRAGQKSIEGVDVDSLRARIEVSLELAAELAASIPDVSGGVSRSAR